VPDIALDDGSRSDTDLKVREADLTKHLINDRNQDQASVAAVSAGSTFNFTPAARPQGLDEKDLKPEPGEVVAKSDYELAQAIAFLKSRGAVRASAN
jgi:carboxyl-terminal processing protease